METAYRSIASLLLPIDPRQQGVIVEADDTWRLDLAAAAGADMMVWGRAALSSGAPPILALRSALARRGTLHRLTRKPPRRLSAVEVHPFPPPRLRPGRVRNRFRDVLLGGAIVELAVPHRPDRILDAAAQAAGCADRINDFRPASGGSILARVRSELYGPSVFRVGLASTPADPGPAADALRHLRDAGVELVPRLLAEGRTDEASWTLETELPGRRPGRLSRDLLAACVRLCTTLPTSDGPPEAARADLAALAANFPQWSGALSTANARIQAASADSPAVFRHGDLWIGNILADRDRLTGVTDWDASSLGGVPGTDLLHLLATAEASRSRRSFGEIWLSRPWSRPPFREVTAYYWSAIGVRPDAKYFEAVGLAWWAGQTAASLSRLPHLVDDAQWVRANVTNVLAALSR